MADLGGVYLDPSVPDAFGRHKVFFDWDEVSVLIIGLAPLYSTRKNPQDRMVVGLKMMIFRMNTQ